MIDKKTCIFFSMTSFLYQQLNSRAILHIHCTCMNDFWKINNTSFTKKVEYSLVCVLQILIMSSSLLPYHVPPYPLNFISYHNNNPKDGAIV